MVSVISYWSFTTCRHWFGRCEARIRNVLPFPPLRCILDLAINSRNQKTAAHLSVWSGRSGAGGASVPGRHEMNLQTGLLPWLPHPPAPTLSSRPHFYIFEYFLEIVEKSTLRGRLRLEKHCRFSPETAPWPAVPHPAYGHEWRCICLYDAVFLLS